LLAIHATFLNGWCQMWYTIEMDYPCDDGAAYDVATSGSRLENPEATNGAMRKA
jgi:hypothetical protein